MSSTTRGHAVACTISGARRAVAVVATAALLLVGAATAAAPAHAADPKPTITIGTIKNKSVTRGKTATIKPVYKTKGNVKVVRAQLHVVKNRHFLHRYKRSVKLPAGKYKITTLITYKTWRPRKVTDVRLKTVTVPLTQGAATLRCTVGGIVSFEYTHRDPTHRASLECVDPVTRGTVTYGPVDLWFSKDQGIWIGHGLRGDGFALANLWAKGAQDTIVAPRDELKAFVSTRTTRTVKDWSYEKTKQKVQWVTVRPR